MRKFLFSFFLSALFLMAGCSISEKVVDRAQTSFINISAMSEAAGKPAAKKCADYLVTYLESVRAGNVKLEQLKAMKAENILDRAFKAYLIAELSRDLGVQARSKFEKEFASQCGEVQAQLLINIISDFADRGV